MFDKVPEWLRPLGLRRSAQILLALLAIITIGDIFDCFSAIGVECTRNFSDRERTSGLNAQFACKIFPYMPRLADYCKAGFFADFISYKISLGMCMYGLIVLSAQVPLRNYVRYLNWLTLARAIEEIMSVAYTWDDYNGGINKDSSNPCYSRGLDSSNFLESTHPREQWELFTVALTSCVTCLLLNVSLYLLQMDLERGGTGDSLAVSSEVMDMIAAPTPSVLVLTDFFGVRSIATGTGLIMGILGLVSFGQLMLSYVRLVHWCPGALTSETTVCHLYGTSVGLECATCLAFAIYSASYLMKSENLRKLMTLFKLSLLGLLLTAIVFILSIYMSSKYYPSYILQAIWCDQSFFFARGALYIALLFSLYSMSMIRKAGGSCREPPNVSQRLVRDFYDADKEGNISSIIRQEVSGFSALQVNEREEPSIDASREVNVD